MSCDKKKCSRDCYQNQTYGSGVLLALRDESKIRKPTDGFKAGDRVIVEGSGPGIVREVEFQMLKVCLDSEPQKEIFFDVRFCIQEKVPDKDLD